jgi:hypothetical protein
MSCGKAVEFDAIPLMDSEKPESLTTSVRLNVAVEASRLTAGLSAE